MTDLWPMDFGELTVVPPIALLREQAKRLTERTHGQIEGRVATLKDGEQFVHAFSLVVPSLDDYTYLLLNILHSIQFYPATIEAVVLGGQTFACGTHEELVQRLRDLLSSEESKRVIRAILAQVETPIS